ncbi:MAG: TonB-dependent receptor [Bacteroidetes bacterium]|jgi:hypothetical protein|nr:TonB-dependent receptor [Bacteroidota bacterium]MDF1866594.1 TonB-dependent receptor [Saprospiraceae bacterium]
MKKIFFFFSFLFLGITVFAQQGGTIRGNVYDKESGEPIIFGNIILQGTDLGTNTDENGFFSIGNVPEGDYKVVATYIGYDSIAVDIKIRNSRITTQQIFMSSGVNLGVVDVSARREKARSDVQISKVTVSASQIKSLPSTGGQADIAQYLTVIPGILSSGDQGGQIYIRGGSPIQNKILLDGMTIYNPFHSIGFFSVFETEIIKTVDVLTGGFNAEYGGRISAIVDLKTREGNKKRLSGQIAANPFQGKVLVEGPIKKFQEGEGSTSFIFTAKKSYIDKTSPLLYDYAVNSNLYQPPSGDTTAVGLSVDELPFSFTDLYGKLSFNTSNGSKFNVFGFNFSDKVDYVGLTELKWDAVGAGTNFTVVPPNSNVIIGGTLAFSDYEVNLSEVDGNPRTSGITAFNAILDFSYFGLRNEVKYGFEVNGFDTDFEFKNFLGNTIKDENATTELAGFIRLKQKWGNWIFEPSLRAQFYISQEETKIEPRLGAKYNATDDLRFKFAGGMYSQNLVSSVNELDVINLFQGFLAGPEEQVFDPFSNNGKPDSRLQTSFHGVAGVEYDLLSNLELNVEGYYKGFTQLIQINRNKRINSDPNFTIETGDAYGLDVSMRYQTQKLFLWATYSLGFVNRDDGTQEYPTIFDRRHNANILLTYSFGKDGAWEAAARWNGGTGFPFTLTQGFYEEFNFTDGITTDILSENGDLGVILDEDRNGGRLPSYHRMDLSLKRTFIFSKYSNLEAVVSVTNAYNRDNIFFVDRETFERVDQLPILPSVGLTFNF